jgi:hypothetical protein
VHTQFAEKESSVDLFKSIALFVGWLTSSLAGIGAILYSCGYLVTRAQLRSLGLFGLFEHSPEVYLQEGANFFIVLAVTFVNAINAMLLWLAYTGIILLFFLIISFPLAIYLFRKREHIKKVIQNIRDALARRVVYPPWLWRNATYLALLLLLIFYLTSYLREFKPTLEVSNVLYSSAPNNPKQDYKPIRQWILAADRDNLENHFRLLLWGTLQTVLALALTWYVTPSSRLKIWLLLPFIVTSIMYTLFLPIAYGALVRPTRFPVVTLTSQNKVLASVKDRLFLLNKTEHEFILWDSKEKRVLWIPNDQIDAAEVKEIQLLFERTNP